MDEATYLQYQTTGMRPETLSMRSGSDGQVTVSVRDMIGEAAGVSVPPEVILTGALAANGVTRDSIREAILLAPTGAAGCEECDSDGWVMQQVEDAIADAVWLFLGGEKA